MDSILTLLPEVALSECPTLTRISSSEVLRIVARIEPKYTSDEVFGLCNKFKPVIVICAIITCEGEMALIEFA